MQCSYVLINIVGERLLQKQEQENDVESFFLLLLTESYFC